MKSAVETKGLNFNNVILNFMKKLNKLQINSERLMKNEDLMTFRGGDDAHWIYCFNENGGCGNMPTPECDINAWEWCERVCPGLTHAVCSY